MTNHNKLIKCGEKKYDILNNEFQKHKEKMKFKWGALDLKLNSLSKRVSYWKKKFNINISIGFNTLQQIYSAIRTLQPDGKTNTSWLNLSGRKEYETSIWGGINIGKKLKLQ